MPGVAIRPIQAKDLRALRDFYATLSGDSRHSRFLGCTGGISEELASNLCAADRVHDAGFVAREIGGTRRIVGHVTMTPAGPREFEIGIAVADGFQHHGIGQRLFVAAIHWAEGNSVGSIVATTFTDNWRVINLLRSSEHPTFVRDAGCGLTNLAISISDGTQLKPAA